MTFVQWVLIWDPVIQSLGLGASVAGLCCSLWLTHEAWSDYQSVRHNGELEHLVARSHLRSQVVVLVMQTGFAIVSLLVLFLPSVPPDMALEVHGNYVLGVIGTRKLTRLTLILVLLAAAIRQAADRRRALALLRLWSARGAR